MIETGSMPLCRVRASTLEDPPEKKQSSSGSRPGCTATLGSSVLLHPLPQGSLR